VVELPGMPAMDKPETVGEKRRDGRAIHQVEIEGRVREILNHPCVGLAVGVVRGARLGFFQGHGVADIKSKKPITVDTVFRIASISKTFPWVQVHVRGELRP
jgi:CubicO group peptidase (beta-lactamase class C family)